MSRQLRRPSPSAPSPSAPSPSAPTPAAPRLRRTATGARAAAGRAVRTGTVPPGLRRPTGAPAALGPAARAAAGLLAAAVVLACGTPAHATGYRYWSYWLRTGGSWTYAQVGPAMHTPADGSVEGWRFSVSADAAAKAVQPRGDADFEAVCADTPAVRGRKRVAVLIDPGTAADAPGKGVVPPAARTLCAQVGEDASSADVLAAVARPLRYNSAGVVCAIAGYPAAGCGEEVSGSGPAAAGAAHSGSGPSVGLIAGGAAVAVLGGAAFWQSRRRARR